MQFAPEEEEDHKLEEKEVGSYEEGLTTDPELQQIEEEDSLVAEIEPSAIPSVVCTHRLSSEELANRKAGRGLKLQMAKLKMNEKKLALKE
ncbi:hypothetical protein NDU88_001767 [Pleurodeles waltl]|uniref:Uncharacterized protein n=1 Tax=Pleurodeles waltl TaxID=8319 RepID=A0AAV7T061_PLEWA|nr:hypothetical protein NDU88_001767 [Pleurodeles waltl]